MASGNIPFGIAMGTILMMSVNQNWSRSKRANDPLCRSNGRIGKSAHLYTHSSAFDPSFYTGLWLAAARY